MASSRESTLTEVHKVRVRKYVYFGAGIGLIVLAVLLVVLAFTTRRHDVGAMVLAGIAVVFSVLMMLQSRNMRDIEVEMASRQADEEVGPAYTPPPTAARYDGGPERAPQDAPSDEEDH
jgi:hypothetical protein